MVIGVPLSIYCALFFIFFIFLYIFFVETQSEDKTYFSRDKYADTE